MTAAIATKVPSGTTSQASNPPQHQYGTRIRSNSAIRPSVRLRQSSDTPSQPRKIKPLHLASTKAEPVSPPSPEALSPFPPPDAILHPEDANSKVFIAIGRSFMSVNNCAMTIKDLAEMTMKFGLMCQNVSAAGQAITTYIRNHLHRCEVQQDYPLLLRHVLSGTPSDDELAPALQSRVGGAHCTLNNSDTRVTNFRRGTMVWYLSKAAGAPCPFSRAGIRICEYGENGKVGQVANPGKERKRERDRLRRAEQCGQKRKRLSRACADKRFNDESSADEEPPSKVKLTLRLKPCLTPLGRSASLSSSTPSTSSSGTDHNVIDLSTEDAKDDSDSYSSSSLSDDEAEEEKEESWCLPPYPRRSISIPCYTPSIDDGYFSYQSPQACDSSLNPRRSPSVPFSNASCSPPPNSEDDEDDFHISMRINPSSTRHASTDPDEQDEQSDWFAEQDFDADTQWAESPGPRSPSAQLDCEEVLVKEEAKDVGGLLDAWADFDIAVPEMKVLDAFRQLTTDPPEGFRNQHFDQNPWSWNDLDYTGELVHQSLDSVSEVKEEDQEPVSHMDTLDPVEPSDICESPLSALTSPNCSPMTEQALFRRSSELLWKDVELLGPDSVQPRDLEEGSWHEETDLVPRRASCSTLSRQPVAEVPVAHSAFCRPQVCESKPEDGSGPSKEAEAPLPHTVGVSDDEHDGGADDELVVVHTCSPCVPAICATELEGISVYQMTLGSSLILRRIDTDFINISPLIDFLGIESPPLSSVPNVVIVSHGSAAVCGSWIPVAVARELIGEQPLVNVFLSDQLNERFPPALQEFHRSNMHGRSLQQFGSQFRSTVEAKRESQSSFKLELPPRYSEAGWEKGLSSAWDVEDHLLSVHPPFAIAAAMRGTAAPATEDVLELQTPLSPTEEAIFQTLCLDSDWEPTPAQSPEIEEVSESPLSKEAPAGDRILRRSRRVANASSSRPCTRSYKRKL